MSSTLQFWGLGSGLSNTDEIIEAMVYAETAKITTYKAKVTLATAKKEAWSGLQSSIDNMNDMIKKLSGVGNQNFKTGTTSSDGYFSATVKNNAIGMDYSVSVKQLATKHTVAANKVSDIKASLNTAGSFKINGFQIDVTAEDSLSSIMSKINNAKDSEGKSIGVTSYIIDGVLFMESNSTGVENQLKFEDTNGILSNIGILKDDGSMNTTKEAKNAIITVNDIEIERASNSISDAIDGVTLNLTKITNDPITLSVGNDTTSLKTMITDFINAYNSVISKMSQYTSYDSASGSSGLLNGDSSVNTVKSTLAQAMQSKFSGGAYSYLFDIGISIDKYGQYQIDETKLDAAFEANSTDVLNLFTKGLDNVSATPDESTGIFVSMKNAINTLTGGTSNVFTSKASTFDSQIKTYNNLISKQETYIEKRKKTLEAQFATLETTMNSLNNTSSMLTQISNSMSSNKDS